MDRDRQGTGKRDGSTDMSRRTVLELFGSTAVAASAVLGRAGRAYPAETSRKVRMGVVGGGFGSKFFWHQHPDCTVTGVTDLRADRRETLRRTYKCDAVYDSLEVMIKKARDIDAVAVFSGALDHAKHVKLCMEKGWHVVSACPACFTVEEAAMLKELKERTGLKYMMAESSYYNQAHIHARNLYNEGVLGEVFFSESEYYHDRHDLKRLVTNKKSRFYMPDGSRSWRWGFPPQHYPTHCLAYLVGLTGERITKVSCLGWGSGDHPYLTDNRYDNRFWNETALMRTDKGHMHRCNIFWLIAAGGERCQWFGDKATLYLQKSGVHEAILRHRMGPPVKSMYDLPQQKGGPLKIPEYWRTAKMLPPSMRHKSHHGGSATFISAEFVNALLEPREPAIDLYESLAMTVPGIIAHRSALKDGEQLKVPQFDRPGA